MDEINVIINENPTDRLLDIFNKFAAKAVQDFPELESRFAILLGATNTLHGSYPKDQEKHLADALRASLKDDIELGQAAHAEYVDEEYYGMAYAVETPDPENPRRMLQTLDHELGHLIAPGGNDLVHDDGFLEGVADAFSLIRKQNKIGDAARVLNFERSAGLILNSDAEHFTLPVVQAVEKLSERQDLSKLTPREAANTAYRATVLHTPAAGDMKTIADIFSPVQRVSEIDFLSALHTCAKIMFEGHGQNSDMVYIAGKSFLQPFLDENSEIAAAIMDADYAAEIHLTGNFWDDVRNKIKERDGRSAPLNSKERLAQEANDMLVLGRFDRNPGAEIDTAQYESKENHAYLQRAAEAYAKIRLSQEAGDPNVKSLDQKQVIELARKTALEAPPPEAPKSGWKHVFRP